MDITERKRAEEEIRQSEAKYSTLVEKSNDGIVIIENGIIQFMNTKLEVMTGFTSHKVLGRKFIDFCLPEEQERLMERHMKRMSGEKVTEIYETKLTAGEGSYLPVEINATNIIYQEHPVVLAFIRDITERKRAEETLRESERRYHDLFEGTADIIQSVSLDGRFVFVNRAWHEMLGYSES
jgi:PAS domain S-box-containing protein